MGCTSSTTHRRHFCCVVLGGINEFSEFSEFRGGIATRPKFLNGPNLPNLSNLRPLD